MKQTPKQYAVALYDVIQEKKMTPLEIILDRFVHIIERDGMMQQSEKILDHFRRYWNQKKKEVDVYVDTAQKISKHDIEDVGKAIQEKVGAQTYTVTVHEDPALLGGAVIQYEDVRIDGSIRCQLARIRKHFNTT